MWSDALESIIQDEDVDGEIWKAVAWVLDSMEANHDAGGWLDVRNPSSYAINRCRFSISSLETITIHQEGSPKDVVPMPTIFELLKIGPISFFCDVTQFARTFLGLLKFSDRPTKFRQFSCVCLLLPQWLQWSLSLSMDPPFHRIFT